ncbi:effector-associated constant component EACC1 [Kitasatospora sp. NPDC004240]
MESAVRVAISARTVEGEDVSGDLRRWLSRQPELRGAVRRDDSAEPPPGTMGATGDLLLAVLAPGGVAAVLATAVVAWVQNRRGSRSVSVTVTRPDGGQVTVTSDSVRPMSPERLAELTRRVADVMEPGPPVTGPAPTAAAPPTGHDLPPAQG